uniref:Nucleoside-diphosphatase mig-23 n=1 Tax=Ascaris lumbricoides TaxID=6252 RepID=A0A0M3I958_ASCLU
MNFLCQLLLLIVSLIVISIVNEVLSSEHRAHDYWLRTDDIVEVRHCLSPASLNEEKQRCRLYTVVIDAGSTGTRMHLFEFSYDLSKNAVPFRVEKETFKEVKPGLSAFALKPEGAADSVSELITAAKATVPRAHWQHTPITLRATAGLRLLPSKQADSVLNSVRERMTKSGFLLDAGGVDIMSGTDEGVFSWFTLNVLTDRMQHIIRPNQSISYLDDRREGSRAASKSSHLAAAALDLGGGSTQITFEPSDRTKVFAEVDESEFSHRLNIFGSRVELYTHSYLGNGLVSARLGITQGTSDSKGPYLMSNCLPAGASINDWNYAGKLWNITYVVDSIEKIEQQFTLSSILL